GGFGASKERKDTSIGLSRSGTGATSSSGSQVIVTCSPHAAGCDVYERAAMDSVPRDGSLAPAVRMRGKQRRHSVGHVLTEGIVLSRREADGSRRLGQGRQGLAES